MSDPRVSPRSPGLAVLGAIVLATAPLTGCHHCEVSPESVSVDTNGNDFLEPGEAGSVMPSWHYAYAIGGSCPQQSQCPAVASLSREISSFTGPAGGVYEVLDQLASYSIPIASTRSCTSTADCYSVWVSAPNGRPQLHWDAFLTEGPLVAEDSAASWLLPLSPSALAPVNQCPISAGSAQWTLHVGHSFSDVDASSSFYPYIEKLLHNSITAGCGNGAYCPGATITRDQMSVFLLKSKHGHGYVPPPCTGVFQDVPCPGTFTNWVEEVAYEGIIDPCGIQTFCPGTVVTRRAMAVWLLKADLGSEYAPPPATGIFEDVPVTEPSAPWIENLHALGITAGCSAQPPRYCPDDPNTRAQMAVFLDRTFSFTF